MAIREANEVLEQILQAHKQELQTVRRYPETIARNKRLLPELSYVKEKHDWLATQAYHVLPARLIELTNDNIHKLLKAAQNGQLHGLAPDEILPTAVAFLLKAGEFVSWRAEEGPYLKPGSWLNEPEPWEDKGQWPESKGNWYLFLGDQLVYTAHSKDDLISYLIGKVYKIGTQSDEDLRKDEYTKALLDE